MEQHISGRMKQVGIQVQEVYSFELDLDAGHQDAFRDDPAAMIRAFLEQEGHAVNSVSLLLAEGSPMDKRRSIGGAPTVEMRSAYHRGVPGQRELWLDLLLRLLGNFRQRQGLATTPAPESARPRRRGYRSRTSIGR